MNSPAVLRWRLCRPLACHYGLGLLRIQWESIAHRSRRSENHRRQVFSATLCNSLVFTCLSPGFPSQTVYIRSARTFRSEICLFRATICLDRGGSKTLLRARGGPAPSNHRQQESVTRLDQWGRCIWRVGSWRLLHQGLIRIGQFERSSRTFETRSCSSSIRLISNIPSLWSGCTPTTPRSTQPAVTTTHRALFPGIPLPTFYLLLRLIVGSCELAPSAVAMLDISDRCCRTSRGSYYT